MNTGTSSPVPSPRAASDGRTTGISSPVPSPRAASDGGTTPNGRHHDQQETTSATSPKQCGSHEFRMPLHYPRYSKSDYESMPEWQLDRLLCEYGLPTSGDVNHKKSFAMGAFLWPDQY
ncbi:hypothetical protein F511_34484 [Dorcoceras hygrometricum]|uniref:DUF7722 domain-containing protein n=1 Tax=Dorcoceras hygrometricum TaxID=472368 RepID=A0A2Z7AMW2_9LAMI|nr:hypothetical protein F511_34484 [Dorcoceras hygrometricum]